MDRSIRNNKIWIDLDNSPHVPFFAPIVKELEFRKHKISLTARNCFQVCGLADLYGLKYKSVGRHYGKNMVLKILGTIYRSLQLISVARNEKPNLALSHGSRSQLLTAKFLKIPTILAADYEYARGLKNIQPDTLLIPELLSHSYAKNGKIRIRTYPGIKEDVYVPEFKPNSRILEDMKIKETQILAILRPPATEAHYHNPESETLFEAVLDFLATEGNVKMVVLPRNEKKQGDYIRKRWAALCREKKLIIPEKVVSGINLMWHSDFVVSGGGTMNREAAALGIPVYTIFKGNIGAIDNYLAKTGRLTIVDKIEDIKNKIAVTKRNRSKEWKNKNRETLMRIVDTIEDCLSRN